ncbi:endonuclease III [Helicobacter sp. 23-1045]
MKNARKLEKLFLERYKGAKTELVYKNLYELTICVILSAQCTDKRVNIVTPALFAKYPNVKSLANAKLDSVKNLIKSVSFFNNKAKNIIAMAKGVLERFGGEIPLNAEDLKSLAGIGQKTANVILLEFCEANLMAVDTHIFRISHRLGLSNAKTPEATERDLNAIFAHNRAALHQAFILFGRYICKAINPKCDECFAVEFCKKGR